MNKFKSFILASIIGLMMAGMLLFVVVLLLSFGYTLADVTEYRAQLAIIEFIQQPVIIFLTFVNYLMVTIHYYEEFRR